MIRTTRAPTVLLAGVLALCSPVVTRGETSRARPTPGFNLFSVEQDVEIGRQSAVEADRQLPLLRNGNVDSYLNKIISKLAAKAPGARYPYAIKAGLKFERYGLEQQGEIVRHTFLLRRGFVFPGAPPLATLESILPFKGSAKMKAK